MFFSRKSIVIFLTLAILFSQAPCCILPVQAAVDGVIPTFQVEPPQGGTAEEILESTYPANNQIGVEVKPAIKLSFKYPIEINDKGLITLKTGDEAYILNVGNIHLSEDEKTLIVDIGRIGELPLRRGTHYKAEVGAGTIKLKDYSITNETITINFVTRSEGQSPKVLGYSSYINGSDDIKYISSTRLSPDGYIYIQFDRNIQWEKNTDNQQLLEESKLYRIPKPKETTYDETGVIYDKAFEFEPGITQSDLESEEFWQEIGISDIQIVNNNTIRVKPELPLLHCNQYKLVIKKEFVEDTNGYALQDDVDFYFWTSPSSSRPVLALEGIEGITPIQIEDDPATSGRTIRVIGTNAYGPDKPIVFTIRGEVIPKADEISALERITLIEGYNNSTKVKISKVRFDYYIEGGDKKTKLFIYPETELKPGRYYVLTVLGNVLQNRSLQFLHRIDFKFIVGGNGEQAGIYKIEPDTFGLFDIYQGNVNFTIKGFDFKEDVEYVELKMISGENAGTVQTAVYKRDIEFRSVTDVIVKLQDQEVINTLFEGGAGEYEIKVFEGNGRPAAYNPDVRLKILSRGKPKVLVTDPVAGDIWFNEKALNAVSIDGITRYFLKITFEDIDGSLSFNSGAGLDLLQTSSLYSEGQNEVSMIDREFLNFIQNLEDLEEKNTYISKYIFVKNTDAKEAYLYIPVKPLRSQTTYTATINANIVYFSGNDDTAEANDTISWSFTTNAIPVISDVLTGSVVEDYDEDKPIILKGDFFDLRNVEVYFNNTRARRVRIVTDENGKNMLEVYLPDGRNRLEPGIYTIRVRNDRDHEFEVFGAMSVVKEGQHIPNEEYKVKVEERMGRVESNILRSEDTLVLNRNYTDRRSVEADLDELMGEDVLIRKVRFDGRRNDRIGTFETSSKWANITLYDVGCDNYNSDNKPEIALGRIDPRLAQTLEQKLQRRKIRSEFIQVTGENVRFSRFSVDIPFKGSNGDNLKVLRYDLENREFRDEVFWADSINKTVTINSFYSGIFVVVEE
ncbi:MAG: Ig-like domain-containing protein [Tepidanaerobacteraceae bacterium]